MARTAPADFLPDDFEPPTSLVTERFRLEPLGPQHNDSDLAAWMSSVDHIRATPGWPSGDWPPADGYTLERNREDLVGHAEDFVHRAGFTFTVLDPGTGECVGCAYLYPSKKPDHDVQVLSWTRADHADLDGPLADALAAWIETDWPWTRPDRHGR